MVLDFKIDPVTIENTPVIRVSGEVDLHTAPQLLSTLDQFQQAGHTVIVLNLVNTQYIDSTGLGQLVGSFATALRKGGQMKLLNLTKKVREVLQITKLSIVFEIFEDEGKAIQSFKVPAPTFPRP